MTHSRTSVTWAASGGPIGTTKFRWAGALTSSDANQALSKQKAFFDALVALLPAGVTITQNALCEHLSTTGDILDTVSATTVPAATTGTGTGVWSSVTGAWVNWRAAGHVNGRGVVGRTFLVPLSNTSVFQTDGTLASTAISAITNAATTMITGFPQRIVWIHRGPTESHPEREEVFGEHLVQSVNVPDKAGVLRSRRD